MATMANGFTPLVGAVSPCLNIFFEWFLIFIFQNSIVYLDFAVHVFLGAYPLLAFVVFLFHFPGAITLGLGYHTGPLFSLEGLLRP